MPGGRIAARLRRLLIDLAVEAEHFAEALRDREVVALLSERYLRHGVSFLLFLAISPVHQPFRAGRPGISAGVNRCCGNERYRHACPRNGNRHAYYPSIRPTCKPRRQWRKRCDSRRCGTRRLRSRWASFCPSFRLTRSLPHIPVCMYIHIFKFIENFFDKFKNRYVHAHG